MDRPDFFQLAREILAPLPPRWSAVEEDRRIRTMPTPQIIKLLERRNGR